MAAALVHNCFCNSYCTPENASPRQAEAPKSKTQFKPRIGKPVPVKTKRRQSTSPMKPNDLSLTRALRGLVDSGSMESALYLFEKMNHSDTYIWNVVIRGLTNNGMFREAIDFYRRMESEGVRADNFTVPFVIKACAGLMCLEEGQKVQAKLIKTGLDLDVYVCNFLINMYVKFGLIQSAEKVFDEMPVRDLVSWNSVVSGYLTTGDRLSSLLCFREMLDFGEKPDKFSMISAIGACSVECCLQIGKEIHCQVIRSGLESDIMVQTSLVDMYGKGGRVNYAERAFYRIPSKNIVACNAMIGAYALNAHFVQSFSCLKNMQEIDNLVPDTMTLINLLPSCSGLGALSFGKAIHAYAIRKTFLSHIVLGTALVDMYSGCGELKLAECVFGGLKEKNLVSWNTMIASYVKNGENRKALKLFKDIWYQPFKLDAITIASILPAYADAALLSECKQIHAYIMKSDLGPNIFISNAAVYMYAKCGDLQSARKIFDGMACKNVVSWNTIIMAYAIHGFGETSVQLFSRMRDVGIKPNGSTFVSLLSSCSISGMVDEAWRYFDSMKRDYNIDPGIEHFGCMIDLLGRTRDLDAAKDFIEAMPLVPTARIWGSLLTASSYNNDIVVAELAAKHILSSEHDNTGCYILLSKMYAEAGRWEDVDRIKFLMKEKGLVKTTGGTTVETNGKSHRFIDQDNSHPQASMIYNVLDVILKKIREDTDVHSQSKFRPIDLLKKREKSPRYHSVKLAICFGLISTAIGNPVVVRKNIRMCEDCHSTAKKISQATKREIIVGDSKAFHHFRGGFCSCGDYW